MVARSRTIEPMAAIGAFDVQWGLGVPPIVYRGGEGSLDVRHLRTFRAVARAGSLTGAAASLDYAQSSVTAHIRALELDLGVVLFRRTARGVSLTDAGARLLVYAETIPGLADEARQAVHLLREPRGPLTIGSSESLCAYRLPGALASFRARFPDVRLTVQTGTCAALYAGLRERTLDMAVAMDEALPSEGLLAEPLRREPVRVLAAPGHSLTRSRRVLPEDLAGVALVLTEVGCSYREVFLRSLADAGVRPPSIATFASVEAVKQCVTAGMGVTLLPAMTVMPDVEAGHQDRPARGRGGLAGCARRHGAAARGGG